LKDVLEDYMHPNLLFSDTQRPMQLDVFLPALSLALEYQGIQHYEDIYHFGQTHRVYKQRDQEKREACKKANITLVEIPYWWDNTKESLKATIQKANPKLITEAIKAHAIPSELPKSNKQRTNAQLLMTASDWVEEMDPTNWYVSEKLDGVRAYWDGSKLYPTLQILTLSVYHKDILNKEKSSHLQLIFFKACHLLRLMENFGYHEEASIKLVE
jgi:hypothetical protein